jgi:hypothetical protein
MNRQTLGKARQKFCEPVLRIGEERHELASGSSATPYLIEFTSELPVNHPQSVDTRRL